jgi:hypothetical protein
MLNPLAEDRRRRRLRAATGQLHQVQQRSF